MKPFWESTQRARHEHHCSVCPYPIKWWDEYKRTVFSGRSKLFVLKEHHPYCPFEEYEQEEYVPLRQAAQVERIALVYELVTVQELILTADGTLVVRPNVISVMRAVAESELFGTCDDEVAF